MRSSIVLIAAVCANVLAVPLGMFFSSLSALQGHIETANNVLADPAAKRSMAEDAIAYPDSYKRSAAEDAIAYPDSYKRNAAEDAIAYPDSNQSLFRAVQLILRGLRPCPELRLAVKEEGGTDMVSLWGGVH